MSSHPLFAQLPVLETERLLLRPLVEGDARDIFEYAREPEVTKYLSWNTHETVADAEEFLGGVFADAEKELPVPWGMVTKAEGRVVGTCGYQHYAREDSRAEFGYVIAKELWGQGLMPEAVRAMLKWGFQHLNLHRAQAYTMVGNRGSERVMQKVGMTFEGVFRGYTHVHGAFRDVKYYSILRTEASAL